MSSSSSGVKVQKPRPAPIILPRSDEGEILIEQLEFLLDYHFHKPHINCSRCQALRVVRAALLEPFETKLFED